MKNKTEIIEQLSQLGIGLKRKTVALVMYNAEWANAFKLVQSVLQEALLLSGSFRIEHVGSTSIPGILAKPVIDILIVIENKADFKTTIAQLENLGFCYKGDGVSLVHGTSADPERHFFSFYNDAEERDFVHLHLYHQSHPDVPRLLNFRDLLRTNKKLAVEYEHIKESLYNNGAIRREYTRLKSNFVAKVLK